MGTRDRYENEMLLDWLRGAFTALATYMALTSLHFVPAWGAGALALAAGALTLASTDLGILVALIALSLPMLAVSPITGVVFIILAVSTLRYLGTRGGRAFFIISAALAGAAFGPVWAAVALAGYVFGPTSGSLAAGVACLVVEAYGIAMGEPTIGVTVTGGVTPLLDLARLPESLFAFQWFTDAFGSLDSGVVEAYVGTLGKTEYLGALITQPLLWAAGAAITGKLAASFRESGRSGIAFASVLVGVLVPGIGSMILHPLLGVNAGAAAFATALASSLVAAPAAAFLWDRTFPVKTYVYATPARPTTMAAEDADVDELLRLIATAEDKLATQHTTVKTVMITDMKSFSRMTEEDGSMVTAKAIQRHRDLLLPIIEKAGGHGKSTGGDGLVAAFDDAASAAHAAARMQQALAEYNRTHADERELTVRIGIADGEVVLDRGGRPFIGAALNVAARVMNLADGGQAFATASVASAVGEPAGFFSHGPFELKNIAEPVEVFEIIWAEGQEPVDPRSWMSA